MTQTQIYYRLRIRNEADSANVIVLSSHPGDTNALLCEAPGGDGQTIDPIMGTLEVGSYTWQAIDRYDGGDTYTITSILADADARNQVLSHKCIGEYSTDGSSWNPLHTGHLNDLKLSDAKTYTFIVGDTDRRERDAKLFKTKTTTFDKVSNIIGGPVEAVPAVPYLGPPARAWGPIIDYGPARMKVIGNQSGGSPNPAHLVNADKRITLNLTFANLAPLFAGYISSSWNKPLIKDLKWSIPAEYIDEKARPYFEWDADGVYATTSAEDSQPWGSFPQIEVRLRRVSDNAEFVSFPIAQATKKKGTTPDQPNGDYSALVANSNDWLIVAWDIPTMGSQPALDTEFDVWVRPIVISEENPLHIRGHPIDIHQACNSEIGIPDDDTSAAATKTALGDLFYELRITEEMNYSDFTEMLKSSAGYAVRYNTDGEQEFFATRAAQPDAVETVTPAKIIGDDQGEPKDVIFRVSESTAIKGIDYKLKQFRLWSPKTDSEGDCKIDGCVADDLVINGTRRDDNVKGSKIVTFDVPGMIMLAGGSFVFNQPMALRTWVTDAGDVIVDRAGWGWIEYEYEVLATVAGKVGDYHDLEAPHQINAKVGQSPVTQRGGTRKVQITSRTEMPGTSKIKAKDAGNLAQDAPTSDAGGTNTDPNDGLPVPTLTLAPSTDDPFTVATVTETNVADFTAINADTELQYLVQTATPSGSDEGDPFGPLLSSTGADTIDAPAIASGETIWVRGRATIKATGQLGDWSTWTSITLGPDDDGTGATLPPFLLALAIDSSGVLSATASSTVAAITKVYFVAGVAGGAPPSYADILGGLVDSSGPPFTATPLATMAEGEVRTVGAIGEDALGNRTVAIFASITRTVDTGSSSGTPGNWIWTLQTVPPVIVRNVGADAYEPPQFKLFRKYFNTNNSKKLRIQLGNHLASGDDVKACVMYSLDGGATPLVESGVEIRLDRVNFPEPGAYLSLTGDAIGPNVLLGFGLKGGDDTSIVKLANIIVESVSSDAPPDSPSGDGPGDLPTGGAYGDLILDHNADTVAAALGLIDNDPLSAAWPDDSPSGNDAVIGPAAPVYKANGAGSGKPSVRFTAGSTTQQLSYNVPTNVPQTRYIVIVPTTGYGSGGRSFDNGVIISQHGASNIKDLGISVRADGKIVISVGENAVATTFRSDVTASAYTGAIHLLCLVYNDGIADLYIDDMTASVASVFPLDGGLLFGYPTEFMALGGSSVPTSIGADYCRNLCWDAAHDATQRAAIKAILQARWGTP